MSNFAVIALVLAGIILLFAIGLGIFRAAEDKSVAGPRLMSDLDGHYKVLGKRVVCPHCGQDVFEAREILLNAWLLSLLSLEWLDAGSTLLVGQKCGRLTWFSQNSPDLQ